MGTKPPVPPLKRIVGRLGRMGGHLRAAWRRREWITTRASSASLSNLLKAASAYLGGDVAPTALPVVVKVDISPRCNLRCATCVHARPFGHAPLVKQRFPADAFMSVRRYRELVRQMDGRVSSVSLFYLGDPLVHPRLDELCRISAGAGLAVAVSTNFSFHLSDGKMRSLLESGVSHLRVCVDGASQKTYAKTRVGGDLGLVLKNLRRACRMRAALGRGFPRVEVQFVRHAHNIHEEPKVRRLASGLGVDSFTAYWGDLNNYVDRAPDYCRVLGPRPSKRLPLCPWLWFGVLVKYNGDVIPCCWHRMGQQYMEGGDMRTMGNVFEQGLSAVWNSPSYRHLRGMAVDPQRADGVPATESAFCNGCSQLYRTTVHQRVLAGAANRFEDVYTMTPSGPRRRKWPSPVVSDG